MKGMQVPDLINPQMVFSVTNFDQEAFDSFPDFIKDKIQSSNEYKAVSLNASGNALGKPEPESAEFGDISEDDLPW